MSELTIQELCRKSHDTAVSKGFWEDPNPNPGEKIALMHSELSEALEELRSSPDDICPRMIYYNQEKPDKPEGLAVELADLLIRVGDFCAAYGVPIAEALRLKMAYNETRPHKHGRAF